MRKEEYRRRVGKQESLQRGLQQPEARWQLRMKFLEQAKSYIGVPYAKKYHKPGTPEFESPLFLDCCGLIRRVSQDLTEELGFYMGPGNQAYQYDTLPITLPSQEHLKPGDLIFISGIYFDPQRMRQPHDIVHVEIWLGEGERSLGARWKTGRVQVFDSYKFVSKTYGSIEYHFKSIETWLQGICRRSSWQSKAEREELPRSPGEFLELSHEFNQEVKTLESLGKSQSLSPTYLTSHCLDHKWALTRQVPGRKSIFSPWTKESGPAKEDADAPRSTSESQLGNEKMVPKVPSMVDYVRDASPSASQQMEALDLQGFSRAGSRVSGTNNLSTDQMTEGSTFLETRGWSVEGHSPSLEGNLDQERGSKEEGPSEPEPMAQCPEASEGAAPSRPARDFVNMARKSCSTSKVNPKGILVGGRRNKKGRAGTQRGHQHSGGPPSADAGWITEKSLESRGKAATLHLGFQRNPSYCRAGISSSSKEELTNETQSKGHKPSARMNPEEKKPEEPRLGPFFYIGGANGADIVKAYCRKKGWQRIYDNHREDYLLKWCETKCRDTYYKFSEGEQLLYQIPNNRLLTTKIGLLVNLREYERVTKKISRNAKSLRMEDFFPESLRLDTREDRELFFDIYREPHIWICKPTGSNQGRGIFLLKNREDVKKLQHELQEMEEDKKPQYKPHQARVVQRYIDKPLLLEGKKFDVRSYLLVACTDPYMVFFGHGYARLTCLDYNPMSDDMTSHLTNQYMQKKNPLYNHVKEETVWQMDRFNTYVNERFRHANGLPKDWVFNYFTKRMKDIMLQCFRAVKSKLDSKLGYFDLIGCDFLIDEDFKVWLLEMNANPALHTNCSALRNIIPTVVNETLDLVIEIFTKSQKGQAILPLESLCHFALLHNGVTSDNRPPRRTKSRTSLRSLRGFWTQMESGTGTGGAPNPDSSTGGTRVADRHPPKPLEKPFKVEPPAPSDGISLLPNKTVPRSTLPMPQIQLSNVPDLSSCSSAKAILRGSQVCSSGNQYIIKHIPESDRHPAGSSKANSGDEKAKSNSVAPLGAPSKDRSYTAWFHQTFGSRFPLATSNLATIPMTSSQMISFHLQANMPPSVPLLHENAKLPRQLMTHAKPSTDNGKPAAVA